MTDLDTLRRSLRARPPARYGQETLDIAQIMTRGRRLRARRRLTAAGGALCVAVAMFGAVTGVSYLTRTPPAPGQQPATSTGTGHSPSGTVHSPSETVHSPSPAVTFTRTPEPSARLVTSASASTQDASPSPAASSPGSSPDSPTSIPTQRPGGPSAEAVPSAAR